MMEDEDLPRALRALSEGYGDDGRVRSRIEDAVRVRRRRRTAVVYGAGAAAALIVVVALASVFMWDQGETTELAVESGPGGTENSSASTSTSLGGQSTTTSPGGAGAGCDTVPFQPTWLPEGWSVQVERGLGGGSGVPSGWHWAGPTGSFVNVFSGSSSFPVSEESAVDLPSKVGTVEVGEIHEGLGAHLEIWSAECQSWALNAYGLSKDQFERVVSSLVSTVEGFAIWPEHIPLQAVEHRTAPADERWRLDAASTARQFAREVLGWEEPSLSPASTASTDPAIEQFQLEREPGGPSIAISLASLVEGTDGYHWSVVAVSGFSTADLGGSVAVGDGSARLLAPTDRPYASAELRIAHGDHQQAVTGPVAEFEVDLGYEPTSPGYYLVLFRDEHDEVVAAWGNPLPARAFAAG